MDTNTTNDNDVRLRSFLGSSTPSSVPGDIGSRMELPGAALDTIPYLPGSWWGSLSTELAIDPSLEGGEGVLDMRALAEAGANEDGVQGQQNPAAALEEDGGDEEANPQSDLEAGNDRHGHVIVLLDEGANGVSDPVVFGLWLGTISRRDLGGRDDGGDDGGAGVGREVEYGVNGVREQGKEIRGREEPDEGHDCGKSRLISC